MNKEKQYCSDCKKYTNFVEDRAIPSRGDPKRMLTWLSCEYCGNEGYGMREATKDEIEYFESNTIDYKIKSWLRSKKITIKCPMCKSIELEAPEKLFTVNEEDQSPESKMYPEYEKISFACLICKNCLHVIWYNYNEMEFEEVDEV